MKRLVLLAGMVAMLGVFFAGGVALFAPCCIVFLAPSYLAGAVKNRRWRLLPLTFLFAAGLAVVLVLLIATAAVAARRMATAFHAGHIA